jgi:hypothetical protein
MTTAQARPRLFTCRGRCAFGARQAEHHDRLLAVDTDLDVLLELFEIAVTWHELDYSDADVIGPSDWLTFADTHTWHFPERATRALSLAVDIAARRSAGPDPRPPLAEVIKLIRD